MPNRVQFGRNSGEMSPLRWIKWFLYIFGLFSTESKQRINVFFTKHKYYV